MTQKLKKYILILSAIFAFTFVSFANESPTLSQENKESKVFFAIDKAPEFPGGFQALMRFLSDNIQYPAEARTRRNIQQGRVIVQFVIDETGKVVEVKVIESVSPALDREAVRVVESMPNWTPGKHEGEKVRVKYTLPINFRINERNRRR